MKQITGGVTAAKGFQAASTAAGIKYKDRKDMAMIYSEVPCKAAGTFTTNIVKAAPVKWNQEIVYHAPSAQAVIINAGIANACTGEEGMGYCKQTAEKVEKVLGIAADEVLVASTGVIGMQLPIDRICNGIDAMVPQLKGDTESGTEASKAIMTTDTKNKEVAVTIELGGKTVTIGGMCKGSGMIHPNMCTMLSFVTTDAAISKELLQEALSADVQDTYNMISVDGDTSTNDTCLLLANGLAENPEITEKNADYEELQDRKKLYEYIKERLVKGKKTYVFLDEIQNVNEFEKTVDSLFINKDVDLYITGSNAYLLSSELATLLTGRYIEIKMLPLSFKEYLSSFEDKTDLSRKFRDYLRYSSFPQAVELYKINPENISLFLDGIYNTILFKDVMQRKGITDKNVLERVTKYLYDNIGNRTSMKSISDNIEGIEKNSSYNTISNYVDALIDSYLIFKANRYDIKGKEFLKTQEKYYAIDIGLRYYMLGQGSGRDMGHILENVVYLELLRRGYEVYIGKYDDLEVDFVARKPENTIYYQVALTTRGENEGDNKILDRELTPLKKINDNYPKYILTLDDDLDADFDGIKKINVLDWLLEKND